MKTWLKNHWLLLVIVGISLFLRLYRIGATLTFLEDEGRDLLIVKRMLDTHLPVLLGPQTSTGNMYLGPLYYYLITPWLVLSHMDPVGPAIFVALSGGLTAYLLFVLGKKWFSPASGYLAAFLYAVLPFAVSVNRGSWNPNLVPLVAVLMLLVFDRLAFAKAPSRWWWLWYGALVGVMIQLHYMALVFCAALSLALVWVWRRDLRRLFLGIALALVGFLALLSPFFLFEIRNDWVNTKALFGFVTATREHNLRYDPPLSLYWHKLSGVTYGMATDVMVGRSMGNVAPSLPALLGAVLIIVISLYHAIRRRHGPYLLLAAVSAVSLLVLGFYQETIHPHYLEFFIPLLLLLITPLFYKKLNLVLGFALGLACVPFTWGYISSGPTHQAEKARAVVDYIVRQAGDSAYNLVSSGSTNTTPYQYYAFISSHPPVNTAASDVFIVCQDAPCSKNDIDTKLLFIHGPAHPALGNYIGHPLAAYVGEGREVVSNEHVSTGVFVAHIRLVPNH